MDENDVVELTCQRLASIGCEILNRCTATEQGIDIVARDTSGATYYVEAKGGTSSRDGSPGYGKPFKSPQVFDRVAKGVYTSLKLRAAHPDLKSERVILAVPDERRFRSHLEPLQDQLRFNGIDVWYLHDGQDV